MGGRFLACSLACLLGEGEKYPTPAGNRFLKSYAPGTRQPREHLVDPRLFLETKGTTTYRTRFVEGPESFEPKSPSEKREDQ